MSLTSQGLRVAGYRQRVTFRRRRGGYLSLVLLIGLVGGLALGSVAAARRTQSSFSTYLASTNPSDLGVSVFGGPSSGGGTPPNYSSAAVDAVAHLPGVRHVEAGVPIAAVPLRRGDVPQLNNVNNIEPVASVDGLFFDQDRLAVLAGRMADPARMGEVVMTPLAAQLLGVHVGEHIPYGIYDLQQESEPGFGTSRVAPHRRLDATLVGLVQVSNSIVQDDIDRYPTFEFFTPALGRAIVADASAGSQGAITYGLQLDGGSSRVAAVEREFAGVAPSGNTLGFHATQAVSVKVDRTLKPLVIALGVFGGVALLAAVLIAIQLLSRQLGDGTEDLDVLRAFGADRTALVADGLFGVMASIVVGSLTAAGVAVLLSPLSPLGPVRAVYPGPGFAFDWTVLGLGVLVLVVALGATATVLAYRGLPHRAALRARVTPPVTSRVVETVAAAGLPVPTLVGVRFALERGRGRATVPVRSTLLGSALALALVVATLTFGSGLQSLVSQPALYGWNFTYLLNASNTTPPKALTLLDRDPGVVAWDGYDYNIEEIDGTALPFLFEAGHSATKAPISPPILTGHAVDGPGQIVLGASTLVQLHKHLGDTVTVSDGTPQDGPAYVPPTHLTVVGTATMPAVGFSSVIDDHTSMGNGALMSESSLPISLRQAAQSSIPALDGPNMVFVRLRPGVSGAVGLADMQRVATAANRTLAAIPGGAGSGQSISVLGVQRPAEIVNYGTIGVTPAVLAVALAGAAFIALGLTLTASVRRRRRDLALLKTLGFTRRQLARAVAWQASISAGIGIVVGVPVGIAVGRSLWTLFAQEIFAVPEPTVPVLSVVLVALGTLVLANLVAAVPGRMAARTPTALLLRAE
ncbi:MAG TPA: ABC transporter permease [Acidimicrobiales bacterium]